MAVSPERAGSCFLIVAILALTACAEHRPEPRISEVSASTEKSKLHFTRTPKAEDFERRYPAEAQRFHISGHATMKCDVDVAGKLKNCKVLEEAPAGKGFGAAILSLAPFFELGPTR